MRSQRVRLDSWLVKLGLAPSREEAKRLIEGGDVTVDGAIINKPASMVSHASNVQVNPLTHQERWVSRGAYKLIKGLDSFGVDPSGLVCLDVGASTGGFTQVLLRRGALRVYSVDVGYGQLDWSLRTDPRVIVLERINARFLSREIIPELCSLGVCDVSFISLKLVIPAILNVMAPKGGLITLVKPQFEVGRDKVGKKGVVKDPSLHREVLLDLANFINTETVLRVTGFTHSPIRGPEGNIEFLLHAMPIAAMGYTPDMPDVDEVVLMAHRDAI